MRRFATLVAACLTLAGMLAAQTLPTGVKKVTSVEGITEYRLENGLQVLLFPDPSKQTATVNVTYKVGSLHEGYGETGMAHLLEHMLFLGSKNHLKIDEEFRAHAARSNGSTSTDRTNYFETFPATDENLKWALELESDRMVNSFVAKEALDKEMTVVRNEFERGENMPSRVLFQRVLSTAFIWHNYGKSTIGAKSDLENVSIERLQAFYKKYYQPDNAVLVVSGKIDEPKTLALVAETFAKIPRPTRKIERPYTVEPVQDGERFVTVRRVGDTQSILAVYKTPDGAHPDMAALNLLTTILADTPSGRLHKALVESKKAASVGAGVWPTSEPGVMLFSATVRKDGNLDEVKDTVLRVVHDIVKEPPTKEELERARQAELKQYEMALNNSESIGLMLSEPIARGDWRLFFLDRDNIKKVTSEDVIRVAKHYLKEDNRTIGLFRPVEAPDRAEIPAITDREAILKDFKGSAVVAQGEAFDPSPENIESRLQRSTLPNGMKLALLPKKTRGATVHGTVTLHFADLESASNRGRAPGMISGMLMRGTKKHTRQQIQDELDRLKARVNPAGGGANAVRFALETTRENLPATLKLLAEILREPAYPENEFDQLKNSALSANEQALRDPQALGFLTLRQHIAPYAKGDLRRTRLPQEEIEEMKATTLDEVKKFYNEFYGASNAEFTLVGDFDPAEMKTLAGQLFGDWKSPGKYTRVPFAYRPATAINQSIETPDKENAVFTAGMPLKLSEKDPDYPALTFANYLFGGGMSSRLFARVRTKEGLSYGVGSGISAHPVYDDGTFTVTAIAAPQNVAKVEAVFKEEIAKLLKDGFTDQEIAEGKRGWLQGRAVDRSQDQSLAGILATNEFEGRTLAYQAEIEKKVAALTAQQIVEALRRNIDPAKISYVKAGDFKKVAAAAAAAGAGK
ncbi:MAG TPA: pitrilysin family protein [Bryobacteraceae bacterium]|nr:pitrilysin family protein [Bryobacteraceae bacterium]